MFQGELLPGEMYSEHWLVARKRGVKLTVMYLSSSRTAGEVHRGGIWGKAKKHPFVKRVFLYCINKEFKI